MEGDRAWGPYGVIMVSNRGGVIRWITMCGVLGVGPCGGFKYYFGGQVGLLGEDSHNCYGKKSRVII